MIDSPTHFFISYNNADRLWAEWIAWQLERSHYTIALQPQDFFLSPGSASQIQNGPKEAECTIVVLSPRYLDELSAAPELASIFDQSQEGKPGRLLPVQVRECREKLGGLFQLIDCIDLVQLDEQEARERLLEDVIKKRTRPIKAPVFPSKAQPPVVTKQPRFPKALPPALPYQQNPLFTGREEILKYLAKVFKMDKLTANFSQPQALNGLSGIGKTQIAVKYAYSHYKDYRVILWAQGNSRESLASHYVEIAHQLALDEKDDPYEMRVINAVKLWLKNNKDWLLILDDVDHMSLIRDFIPSAIRGHILITTHAQAMGRMAQRIQVGKMEPDEGALFLLRRAKFIGSDAHLSHASKTDQAKAREISETMDGLPLALDQAGAYIERTECGLTGYLERYLTLGTKFFKQQGGFELDHPKTVTTTWTISFERVQKTNPAAAELLQFCAFLNSAAIPEEIITLGAQYLGPILQSVAADPVKFDMAIEELRRFSLMHRDPNTQTLSMHRLVQEVLKDAMDEETSRHWVEQVIRAVNYVFPEVEFATWERCQRYLPHVQVCAELIKKWHIIIPEGVRLLHLAAYFLWQHARYPLAKSFYEQALEIQDEALKQENPQVMKASRLHDFALLYRSLGEYSQAENLFAQALSIRENELGPEDAAVASSLYELGWLYLAQSKYTEAEPLFIRALNINKNLARHSDIANIQNELGWLYRTIGRYNEAGPLLEEALENREKYLGLLHPDVAQSLNDLAWLYYDHGRYSDAERLHLRALEIRKRSLHSEHPHLAQTLNNLAWLHFVQGKYSEVEELYTQALEIREKALGEDHPYVAHTLDNLALYYYQQSRYADAEPLFLRALKIREKALGKNHSHVARSLNNLAMLYQAQGKYGEAEAFFKKSLDIRKKILGQDHPHVANCMNNLADLYRLQKKFEKAEELLDQALHIRESALGRQHPQVAQNLISLAQLNYDMGKYERSEFLYKEALVIQEQMLGKDNLHVAQTLKHLAELYKSQGNRELAEQLHKRATTILETIPGSNLSDVGKVQKRRGTSRKRAERRPKPNTVGSDEPNIIKAVPSFVEDEG